MENKKIVIAFGGNAILSGGNQTAYAQQQALKIIANQLVEIIKHGYQIAVTHGNGPQVGNIFIQQMNSDSEQTPAMPLDTCGAMSQGMIGYWLENELDNALNQENMDKEITTMITRVEVDPEDEAFDHPTKPIGPFFTKKEAKIRMEKTGAIFTEDAGRGWRKVVPSPKPLRILEQNIIKALVNHGTILISGGGGGIPVYRKNGELHGVEAVIDKDYTSKMVADLIDADILLFLTEVEHVYIHFNKPGQQALEAVSSDKMKEYMNEGQFAPGSMLPKIETAVSFVDSKPGRKAIITSLGKALDALLDKCGTRVLSKGSLIN